MSKDGSARMGAQRWESKEGKQGWECKDGQGWKCEDTRKEVQEERECKIEVQG